jgi:hypothetical protein
VDRLLHFPVRAFAAVWIACIAGFALQAAGEDSVSQATLFDPARHMHLSEVQPGMKGYGLTVFQGTKIEKFGVEVIDVVKNFNPKYDVILVRCEGDLLEHSGAIEGMSGSPIYLYDASGKAKMVGAFAYGWPLSKDPLGGVQPIEYMLKLPDNPVTPKAETAAAMVAGETPRWSLDEMPAPWGRGHAHGSEMMPTLSWPGYGQIPLQPLATPVMVGKVGADAMRQIAPLFEGSGLTFMQAGGGNGTASGDGVLPPLEPGSVLALPILTGDLELTAIGTCTEKIGDRIFGFGHPFMSEGVVTLPVGSGSIAMIVPNLQASFKLGYLSKATGTLTTDETVGVAGRVGVVPPMVPIDVHVTYADGSVDQTFHFNAAVHPKLTPQMAAAAVAVAMTGRKDLPEYQTVKYDLNLEFANGQAVHLANTSVNEGPSGVVNDVLLAVSAATDNPFQEVTLSKLSGTVEISDQAREAQILSVMVPRSKYEPGDTVKGYISYQPFRSAEALMPVELKLPRDLPNGDYQLTVSDWSHYFDDERSVSPFEFTANNIDEMFEVLRNVGSIRHDAIYLRLVRRADGVAVGRTAMPLLPSSQRQVMMDSGRSDITSFVSSDVKIVPSDQVMSGVADFTITIEKQGKVETASPKAKTEIPPAVPAAPAPAGSAGGGKEASPKPPAGPK